ncbi:MAG TPA: hypothetical protein VGD34_02685 [Kribbella sp.]|jgi:hypothetical protein
MDLLGNRPVTADEPPCQVQSVAGNSSGSVSRKVGSAQSRSRSLQPEFVSSNSPDVNSAARSDRSLSGCIAPPRPNCTITLPPWNAGIPNE